MVLLTNAWVIFCEKSFLFTKSAMFGILFSASVYFTWELLFGNFIHYIRYIFFQSLQLFLLDYVSQYHIVTC